MSCLVFSAITQVHIQYQYVYSVCDSSICSVYIFSLFPIKLLRVLSLILTLLLLALQLKYTLIIEYCFVGELGVTVRMT